jgi:hypothetical protein
MSSGRACKIAVVGANDLAKKDQLMSLVDARSLSAATRATVSAKSFGYDAGGKLSDDDLQALVDSDLVYFFYDADTAQTAQESRKSIVAVLDQISGGMARAGKEKVCYAVAALPKLPVTKEQTQVMQRGAGLVKQHGFIQVQKPVCATSGEEFKRLVLGHVNFSTMEDDRFASVASAPAPTLAASQPVPIALPMAAAAAQVFAAPAVDSAPAPAPIVALLGQGAAELDKALTLAEAKLQHELANLQALRQSAARVLQAHKNRDTDEDSFFLAAKKFGETAKKVLDGKADMRRMLGGAIACFIGVILLAISIPFFFVAPPFGLAAVVTSAHLISAVVVGGLLNVAGAYSIWSGREQGVVRESKHFVEMTNKPMQMVH